LHSSRRICFLYLWHPLHLCTITTTICKASFRGPPCAGLNLCHASGSIRPPNPAVFPRRRQQDRPNNQGIDCRTKWRGSTVHEYMDLQNSLLINRYRKMLNLSSKKI
jgi:hypothetical protein